MKLKSLYDKISTAPKDVKSSLNLIETTDITNADIFSLKHYNIIYQQSSPLLSTRDITQRLFSMHTKSMEMKGISINKNIQLLETRQHKNIKSQLLSEIALLENSYLVTAKIVNLYKTTLTLADDKGYEFKTLSHQ